MKQDIDFRLEKDSLGEKKVPKDAYYGIHTVRALENFKITGRPVPSELIISILKVKKACCLANQKAGVLPKEKVKVILAAIEQIFEKDQQIDHFPTDTLQGGAYTSLNININEVIANTALEILGKQKGNYKIIHPLDDVNKSQSTNDVIPTALRLTAIFLTKDLVKTLSSLIKELGRRGEEYKGVLKLGRTHLQDAVPITLGQEFKAWAKICKKNQRYLTESIRYLLGINLGGTAIGTKINTNKVYLREVIKNLIRITKLDVHQDNGLIANTQDQSDFCRLSSGLKTLAIALSRIASDLRLMSSGPRGGFNEIILPPVQAGSSIMPGKVNPVIPEILNQTCFQVIANDLAIVLACENAQLELCVMIPLIATKIIESLKILRNTIDIFTNKCVTGIEINYQQCQQNLENSTALATALVPVLGYETCAQIAKEALNTKKTIREIVLEKELLTGKEFNRLTDYKRIT
jgi:aspartate ammonia-lyase